MRGKIREVFIVAGVRTPIGGSGQSLRDVSAVDLGAFAIKHVLEKNRIEKSLVDEVIMGNVVSAGLGQNPARQSLARAGLPLGTSAFTINKVCGSGLKAVMLAAQAIACGDFDVVVAGGMESASNCPYLFPRNKKITELTAEDVTDSLMYDGLWCNVDNRYMGEIAEYTAKRFNISRQDQDRYAFESHAKASHAIENHLFQEETVAVSYNGECVLSHDEKPRKNISLERLANLPSAFVSDGTVTAGNSSAPADGGAALVLASAEGLKEIGARPVARIAGYATATLEPKLVFTASAAAIEKCLNASAFKMSEIDLFEVNEAFAVQALVTIQLADMDEQRLNVFGGTLALGHPLGVSGARGLVTLLNVLKSKKKKTGLTSVCLGGGSAVALTVTMV